MQIENNERIRNQFFEGDLNSVNSIDQAYQTLASGITATAQNCFPVKTFKHFLKPYWNQELRDFHKRMTIKRAVWVADGKPMDSCCLTYKEYKNSKREFRRCHRKYANKYLQNQIDQIDKAAEVDSSLFWRMINARQKKSNSAPGLKLIFNDRHCNTSTEINNEWAKYFAKLYTPTQAAHFDDAFSETIPNEKVNIRNDLEN